MIKRPFQLGWSPAVWYIAVVATCLHATSICIDDFELPFVGDYSYLVGLEDANHKVVEYTNTTGGIVGGNREFQVDVNGVASPLSAYGTVGFDHGLSKGVLQAYTQYDPGTKFTLLYDGTFDGEMCVDLPYGNSGGALVFAFNSNNGGDEGAMLDVAITLKNSEGQTTYNGLIANSTMPFNYQVSFSDFDLTDTRYFKNIESIEIAFNSDATPCVDFELDSIYAVPEPSTCIMLGFGILTLFVHGCLRRKRWYREMIGC